MSFTTVVEIVRGNGEPVTAPLIFPHGSAALLVLPESIECRQCHRMVRLAVNRAGETKCLGCDPGEAAVQTSAPTR